MCYSTVLILNVAAAAWFGIVVAIFAFASRIFLFYISFLCCVVCSAYTLCLLCILVDAVALCRTVCGVVYSVSLCIWECRNSGERARQICRAELKLWRCGQRAPNILIPMIVSMKETRITNGKIFLSQCNCIVYVVNLLCDFCQHTAIRYAVSGCCVSLLTLCFAFYYYYFYLVFALYHYLLFLLTPLYLFIVFGCDTFGFDSMRTSKRQTPQFGCDTSVDLVISSDLQNHIESRYKNSDQHFHR